MSQTLTDMPSKSTDTSSSFHFFNANIRIASTQWSLRGSFILDIASHLAQLSIVMGLALAIGMPLFAAVVVSVMIVPTLFQSIVLLSGIINDFFYSLASNEGTTTNQLII